MTNEKKIELLEKTINALLEISTWVYGKSVVGGKNPYKKRSPWKNGWNAAQTKQGEEEEKILESSGLEINSNGVFTYSGEEGPCNFEAYL